MSLNVQIKKITEAYDSKIKRVKELDDLIHEIETEGKKMFLKQDKYKNMNEQSGYNNYDELQKLRKTYVQEKMKTELIAKGIEEARDILFNLVYGKLV